MNNLVKDFLLPTRIIDKSDNVFNDDCLFSNHEEQIFLFHDKFLSVKGKGFIILDFGREICGGLRILASRYPGQTNPLKIRIRFGESVSETCAELGFKNAGNYHSVRDFECVVPFLSDQQWGETGFRFVRIDFLSDEEYRIVNFYACFYHRDISPVGCFSCSDDKINQIFETAKYTVYLTMQNNLIEGVKRDRLIWIGDMHPQVNAILDLFGADDCIENALSLSVAHSPLPSWLNNIPTYSFWFIQILADYIVKTGKLNLLDNFLPFIDATLNQLNSCVDDFGNIDFNKINVKNGGFFLDWPTANSVDAETGNAYMFILSLNKLISLFKFSGKGNIKLCELLIKKLKSKKYPLPSFKQVVALGFLAGVIPKNDALNIIKKDGANGFTTFLSFFIYKTLSDCDDSASALSLLKEYYGAMLDRGATTFWEDFDISWLDGSGRIDQLPLNNQKDLHGDFGKFCYTGFRHSLCHGWSCGPVHFLLEEVLGVKPFNNSYKKIKIQPHLGNLSWCKGVVPTPFGNVIVEHKLVNGKISTYVDAPGDVEIVF